MQNQNYNQGQPMQQPQQQKTYFGNGKEHIFQDGGSVIRLSFSAQDLQNMQQCLNERGYINLNVNRRQQPSQYGHTHSIALDTWQPQQQAPQQQYQQQPQTPPAYTGNMGQPQQFQQPPAAAPQMQQVQQPVQQAPTQNQQGYNEPPIPF
jgi:hypothetical protein